MMKRKDGTITPFRNAEYLSAYYFIPKRILKQCGKELNSIPRNPQKLIRDYNAVAVVESDLFIQLIQSFYLHELKSVSASTVIHEHANIHKALKYAVKMDLIPFNPADKVERPKKQKYIADYYRLDELEKLFEVTKDHPYSLLIQMTAFYGLRRSEALGLKWDAIDFERNTITIRHIVSSGDTSPTSKDWIT